MYSLFLFSCLCCCKIYQVYLNNYNTAESCTPFLSITKLRETVFTEPSDFHLINSNDFNKREKSPNYSQGILVDINQ